MNTTDRELRYVSKCANNKEEVKWDIPEAQPFDFEFVSCGVLRPRPNLRRHLDRVPLSLTFRLLLWVALWRDDDRKKSSRVLL